MLKKIYFNGNNILQMYPCKKWSLLVWTTITVYIQEYAECKIKYLQNCYKSPSKKFNNFVVFGQNNWLAFIILVIKHFYFPHRLSQPKSLILKLFTGLVGCGRVL